MDTMKKSAGNKVVWSVDANAVGRPLIKINAATENRLTIEVKWKGNEFEKPGIRKNYAKGDIMDAAFKRSVIVGVFDPQKAFKSLYAVDDQRLVHAFRDPDLFNENLFLYICGSFCQLIKAAFPDGKHML